MSDHEDEDLSEDHHGLISSLTQSIAVRIAQMMEQGRAMGLPVIVPEHYCAYSNNGAEELVLRMVDCTISIKVTIHDTEYAKDKSVLAEIEEEMEVQSQIDEAIYRILHTKENPSDN